MVSECVTIISKQAFDIFDEDGSGSIDPIELKDAFEELGVKKFK